MPINTYNTPEQALETARALMAVGADAVKLEGGGVKSTVRIVDAKRCKDVIMKICSRATEDLCVEFMDIPEEWYR